MIAGYAKASPRIKDHRQQLGQDMEMLIGKSQVVQSLCQDSLFRIGGNFQEKVIRRRAPLKENFEKPVGELARLNQFRLQCPPTPHLANSAEIEDAVAVFLNQPFAAFVIFV